MDVERIERGDFQTPPALAREVVSLLVRRGLAPRGVLEPTCGAGALLVEAARGFPGARALGLELDAGHLASARAAIDAAGLSRRVTVRTADVFEAPLAELLGALPAPTLVVGNPPWVTAAALGALGSTARPARSSAAAGLAGLDAVTGRSNFDVSEWILLRLAEAVARREGSALAMLVKLSVARKVFAAIAARTLPFASVEAFRVDARRWFGVAADAVLLLCRAGPPPATPSLALYPGLEAGEPEVVLRPDGAGGLADAARWGDAAPFARTGRSPWRSGVKHDCAPVLELVRRGRELVNGLGEIVDVERARLFPLAKGTALAAGRGAADRVLLLPQARVGEDTRALAALLPRTWRYLAGHRARFDARRSAVYRRRAPFAVFGVGPYSFAPWKVAVPGLHRELVVELLGPSRRRPVLLDDTCAFLAARHEAEARALALVVASAPARALFGALVFPGAKRPWTAALLGRLDLGRAAAAVAADGVRDVPAAVQAELARLAAGAAPWDGGAP